MTVSREINVQVLGKIVETRGFVFKKQVYKVALKLIDKNALKPYKYKNTTVDQELPFHQYCQLNVGDKLTVTMWSTDERFWFFSQEDAEDAAEDDSVI